jgi:hypothetical protein
MWEMEEAEKYFEIYTDGSGRGFRVKLIIAVSNEYCTVLESEKEENVAE